MTSPLRDHDRLREIRAELAELDERLIEDERTANGLVGLNDGNEVGVAEAEVLTTRWKISALLREHMRVAESLLKTKCPIHPANALIVTCQDCCEAWGYERRTA